MRGSARGSFKATGAVVLLLATAAFAGCLGAQPEPVTPASAPGAGGGLPPVADFVWTPSRPLAGQSVQFLDRSTDVNGTIVKRTWLLPDGSKPAGERVNFTFRDAGTYGVRLTVEDDLGLQASVDKPVIVLPIGTPLPTDPGAGPRPHVVVAVVDTGINPYHEVFATPAIADPALLLEGYPVDARPLALTLGPHYDDNRKADEATWKAAELNQLYHVPGTRIVGAISFGHDTFANSAANDIPVLDEDGHGTATSSRVALTAPDAWVVMCEAGADSLEQAIAWAASQPWIDIVSVSIGPLLNLPTSFTGDQATHDAWTSGKLVFVAAGNEPSLSATSPISGPPWVVSVGAALPEAGGEPGTAAKAMDLVSDYNPPTASHESVNGTEPRSGTSFSAPTAAGAVAEALFQGRTAANWVRGIADGKLLGGTGPGLLADGLTNQELRDAMNAVAVYWDPTIWSPGSSVPILPAAPWVQMGWGYVGEETPDLLAAALLSGQLPAKSPDAVAYMEAVMGLRQQLWGAA